MTSRKIYFFCNGILANPGDSNGWTDRACMWINSKTDFKAEKFEYFCTAVLKQLWQEKRTQNLIHMISMYHSQKFQIVLVGHSNGCDIICRLLRECPIPIKEIHLFAAATHEDCRKNGINIAFAERRLSSADYYCSQYDEALRVGNNPILRPLYRCIGYGFLGYLGPKHEKFKGYSVTHWINAYGHTDWFKPGLNFERAMHMIVHREPIA